MFYSQKSLRTSLSRKFDLILFSFLIFFSAQSFASPEIIRFWLVDATTNTRITEIEEYQRLTLPFLPTQLSIEAEANGETQSVVMKIEHVESSTENLAPYSLEGDNSGDFVPVPELRQPGWLRISAQPFSADNAGGNAGEEQSLSLYLYQPDFLVTSTLDRGDYDPGDGYCTITKPLGITDLQTNTVIPTQVLKPDRLGLSENTQIKDAKNINNSFAKAGSRTTKARINSSINPELSLTSAFNEPIYDFSENYVFVFPKGCTLRAAIEEANALAGNQSILVDGTKGTYTLNQGQLEITEGVTIRGHEMPLIDANKKSRIFKVDGEGDNIIVNLQGLDIARGRVSTSDRGGAISIDNNALVQMSDSIVRESQANYGGGIYLQGGGDLTMWRSAVRDNIAGTPENGISGGGVTQRGGGISTQGEFCNVTIRDSSIFDNLAVRGGGLSNFAGTMRIENSSVVDNEALALGGGIENQAGGTIHMSFATIVNNQAGTSFAPPPSHRKGGGLYNNGTAFMASSIMAGNTDDFTGDEHLSPDCHSPDKGDFTSYRNNVVGVLNSNCSLTDYGWGNDAWIDYGDDTSPLDPGLSEFQISKGLFEVDLANYFPTTTSIVLGNGATQSASLYPCPDHDMLGNPRPLSARCDIGAMERKSVLFLVPNESIGSLFLTD